MTKAIALMPSIKSIARTLLQVLGLSTVRRDSRLEKVQRSLANVPRYTRGQISTPEWILNYVDAQALISSYDTLIIKGLNDFYSDNKRPLILDCGANIGMSVLRYKHLYPESRIIAFEPDKEICSVLRQNLRQNGVGQVEVVEAAVWIEEGAQSFFSEGADGSRLVDPVIGHAAGHVVVQAVDFAKYVKNQKVDFIKLDIEGAEYRVIEHISPYLSNVDKILVEIHHNVADTSQTARLLQTLADASFSLSINLLGPHIDLRRRFVPNPEVTSDQYLLVCAWRE
jgi:FkbM family methyltransferase